jgi:hypothetical protein
MIPLFSFAPCKILFRLHKYFTLRFFGGFVVYLMLLKFFVSVVSNPYVEYPLEESLILMMNLIIKAVALLFISFSIKHIFIESISNNPYDQQIKKTLSDASNIHKSFKFYTLACILLLYMSLATNKDYLFVINMAVLIMIIPGMMLLSPVYLLLHSSYKGGFFSVLNECRSLIKRKLSYIDRTKLLFFSFINFLAFFAFFLIFRMGVGFLVIFGIVRFGVIVPGSREFVEFAWFLTEVLNYLQFYLFFVFLSNYAVYIYTKCIRS